MMKVISNLLSIWKKRFQNLNWNIKSVYCWRQYMLKVESKMRSTNWQRNQICSQAKSKPWIISDRFTEPMKKILQLSEYMISLLKFLNTKEKLQSSKSSLSSMMKMQSILSESFVNYQERFLFLKKHSLWNKFFFCKCKRMQINAKRTKKTCNWCLNDYQIVRIVVFIFLFMSQMFNPFKQIANWFNNLCKDNTPDRISVFVSLDRLEVFAEQITKSKQLQKRYKNFIKQARKHFYS